MKPKQATNLDGESLPNDEAVPEEADTTYPMKSLRIGHGDSSYDILKYEHDDIGDLLDGILISEKVLRIKCVYVMKG
ncbi:hypothetical protein BBP40_007239 [Aspergillus hancockii]|nr:hypothetical protein BBP40_007239 [Aspergillus hancockii]